MKPFKPTYLYIKKHTITGKKYFGKTTTKNPYTYMGSGSYWKKHITKHGRKHVITLWCQLFENEEELTVYALKFSEDNNIVESDEWLNLVPENGLAGGTHGKRKGWTDERKRIKSEAMMGENNPFYGKQHKEESKFYGEDNPAKRPEVREKMSGPRPDYKPSSYYNGISQEQRDKISQSLMGHVRSLESRAKQAEAWKDTIWVHNGIDKPFQTKIQMLDDWISKGYKRGRGPKHLW